MYALILIEHEAKENGAAIQLIAVFNHFDAAHVVMKEQYESALAKADPMLLPDSDYYIEDDRAFIRDEFCNRYNWIIAGEDNRWHYFWFGDEYECGFDCGE